MNNTFGTFLRASGMIADVEESYIFFVAVE